MIAEKDAPDAFERATESLMALRKRLLEMHGIRHRFDRTLGSQADVASAKFKRGESLNATEYMVVAFTQPLHIRQFQTSVFVTSVVIRQLIDAFEDVNRRNDLTSLLGQLRSILERFAHLHYLSKNVAKKLSFQDNPTSDLFLSSFSIDVDVKNALMGTAVEWNKIASKPLEQIDLQNDLGRGLKGKLGSYFATQVLNKIDELNKACPGTRAAYEILCDFLHPNVGDLFASTTSYSQSTDRFGVHHIVRRIHVGQKSGREPTADRVVLENVYAHFVKLASICAGDFDQCAQIDRALSTALASYTRKFLKAHRSIFKKRDFCPCSSGEFIFRCCGRDLVLGN
jgi:hypothetical protein